MSKKTVSPEDVKQAALVAGITEVLHHDCGICWAHVRYLIQGELLYFDSSCGCAYSEPTTRDWFDAADWINMQADEGAKAEIMRRWGFVQ